MSEIKLNWNDDLLEGDLLFSDNDIETEEGLSSAVVISLFTDRRAQIDDVLPDEENGDKKGWWGDLTTQDEDDEIGSRRWLLARAKTTDEVLRKLKEYDTEALQWMIDDGVAAKIEVEVERQGTVTNPILAEAVRIFKNDGQIITVRFDQQWDGQFA